MFSVVGDLDSLDPDWLEPGFHELEGVRQLLPELEELGLDKIVSDALFNVEDDGKLGRIKDLRAILPRSTLL